MVFADNKQGDPRWGDYPYCPGGILRTHGCGPTADSILLNKDPREIADWMTSHGYASSSSGTDHAGIYMCLRAYGYESSKITPHGIAGVMSSGYFDTFESTVQSGYCVVLLMGGPSTGCRTGYWTSGGHYICIIGYDKKKGYLVSDPATATRDGYHKLYGSAEDCFNGNVKHIFITNIRWKDDVEYAHKFVMPTLKKGSKGKAVLNVQKQLRAIGHYNGNLDGDFGQLTEDAVRRFQKSRKLTVDGIFGLISATALYDLRRVDNVFYLRHVQKGSKGETVRDYQRLLYVDGYYKGRLDGDFGEQTDAAVRKWQEDHNLTVDGSIGKATGKSIWGF